MDPVRVPSIPAASFPLPPRLEGLRRLAYNLQWAWDPRTRGLFHQIDRTSWTRYRNPIPVISGPTDWSRLLDDAKFLAEYHDVLDEFDGYMANGAGHWFQRRYAEELTGPIAYFCAEYGFHESLGIYSGGLGVLAGDHMKTASDMALPAIGIGLLYRKGYFRQTIDADGHARIRAFAGAISLALAGSGDVGVAVSGATDAARAAADLVLASSDGETRIIPGHGPWAAGRTSRPSATCWPRSAPV